ncbi:unnamed protein product, partial [Urochloa humidicola]
PTHDFLRGTHQDSLSRMRGCSAPAAERETSHGRPHARARGAGVSRVGSSAAAAEQEPRRGWRVAIPAAVTRPYMQ